MNVNKNVKYDSILVFMVRKHLDLYRLCYTTVMVHAHGPTVFSNPNTITKNFKSSCQSHSTG
jgi:hypothetical protein